MAVLAVDGGNTKTVAVVAADDGTLRGTSLGGCTDLYGAPSAGAALDELYRVIDGALEAAGVTPQELSGATLSLAGADWDDDFALHRATADERLPGVPVEVVNDAVGPIRCAARDGAGVSLICGTGAAIGARSPDGRSWHIGFTPRNSGAHALGKEALAAIQEADMDCGRATGLTERLLAVFGVAAPRDIVHAVTRRGGLSASDVAALAPHVLAVAADGDAVARDIVDLAGQRMGCWTRHAARQVDLDDDYRLVLAGGLLRSAGSDRLIAAALAAVPSARPTVLDAPPVTGALLMALDSIGSTIDEAALAAAVAAAGLTGGMADATLEPGGGPADRTGSVSTPVT